MFIGPLFILIGVILLVLGIFIGNSQRSYRANSEYTTATITMIEKRFPNDFKKSKHVVYVEYVVDDVSYNGKLNYYTSNMSEGEAVGIYYDPHNPQSFKADSGLFVPVLTCGLGVLFLIIGCTTLFVFRNLTTQLRTKQPPIDG